MDEELKVIITAEIGDLKDSVEEAQEAVSDFGDETDSANSQASGAFEGISASAAAKFAVVESAVSGAIDTIRNMISTSLSYGDSVDKQSQMMQMSARSYQEWDYVLQRAGSDISSLQRGVRTITGDLGDMAQGVDVDTSAYDALGVSLRDTNGDIRSSEDVLGDCIFALADMEDEVQRNALAQELFGRGFSNLLPLLNLTGDEISDLIGVADEYAVVSDEDIRASADLADAQLTMRSAMRSAGSAIAGNLMPYITLVAEKIADLFNFLGEHETLLTVIVGIITALAAAFATYHAVMLVVNTVQAAYAVIQGIVNAAMWACPITWIIAAIVALIAIIVLLATHWDEVKAKFIECWDKIKEVLSAVGNWIREKFEAIKQAITTVVNAIKDFIHEKFEAIKQSITDEINAVKTAVTTIFTAIRDTIHNIINAIKEKVTTVFNAVRDKIITPIQTAKERVIGIFQSIRDGIREKIEAARDFVHNAIQRIKDFFHFEWHLPHLKLPHLNITGEFNLLPPRVPHFSIEWYAQGGVFDSPTLFGNGSNIGGLGENGAEAIVPLENNTQWLNKLADMLNQRMGGRSVVLEVDGKRFGEIACDSINSLTRQRGEIPLRLV